MLLLQLIPVSPSQIPKTSRKVTNLRAESYLVHNLWLFFTTQINFASQWCNRLISQIRQSHLIWRVPHKLVQTLGKPEIIFISSLFLPEEIIIYFPWKKKSKNSKISGTNSEATSGHSEATSGPPHATLKPSWSARILYFALRRSNNMGRKGLPCFWTFGRHQTCRDCREIFGNVLVCLFPET